MEPSPQAQPSLSVRMRTLLQENKYLTVIVLIFAFLLLVFLNKNNRLTLEEQPPTPPSPFVVDEDETELPEQSTLATLLSTGADQECTFSTQDETSEVYGTLYILQGKVRIDTQVRTSGKVALVKNTMINDGVFVYVWGDDMEQGIKMSATGAPSANVPAQGPGSYVNPEEKMSYDCTPTTPPQELFTLPTAVTFMDLDALIPTIPNTSGIEDIDTTGE
jgi:hypothetical protein